MQQRRTLPPGLFARRGSTLGFVSPSRRASTPEAPRPPPAPIPAPQGPPAEARSPAPEEPDPESMPWSFARAIDVNAARRTHARAYEPWTSEEDAKAHALADAGATFEEIALRLQRPPGAVRARLTRRAAKPTAPDPAVQEGSPQSMGP